jgi:adenylate cyclase
MYNLTSLYLELAGVPVGTITFGLPILEADVERIGSIGGFDACLHVEGRCVVRTSGVDAELAASMNAAAESAEALRSRAGGSEWSIRSEFLDPDDPAQGRRIVAVPLAAVVAPFDRIQQALLLGGGGALLLSGLLGALLSRSLTRPVKALVAATGRVAQGDYGAEVTVTTRDEMRTLADAFNDMTRGLLLRERYRSVLNKVVSQDVAAELMKGDVELGGENRLVTVLFADIRGFTALTDGMEPQEVIGLLNECMECLSRAIDAEAGVVDKFIGDEVMAVFGAPVTQDDHARRAVSAAVRMRIDMAELNEARKARGERALGIGVGINSGVAVAGNMGSTNRLNYTVVGDAVNLASRLAGQARAGEILVSGATLRLAGEGVTAPPLGGRALKGFAAEVEVFGVESIEEAGAAR